jgi:hypothetical protein
LLPPQVKQDTLREDVEIARNVAAEVGERRARA